MAWLIMKVMDFTGCTLIEPMIGTPNNNSYQYFNSHFKKQTLWKLNSGGGIFNIC